MHIMRMTKELRAEVFRLKQSGIGYKRIADMTNLNLSTVKSSCKRSGLFADNPEHTAMFTIPEKQYSTALIVPKLLPVQRRITGDRQTDAYLWVLEVINTGEPGHIAAAEEALHKLTISPKDARDNYTRYLEANGAGWTASFSTMMMGDPQHYIDRARTQFTRAAEVRGTFGSYEAALEPTKAEQLMEMVCGDIYDNDFGWTPKEKKKGCIEGKRVTEVWDLRAQASKGFAGVLPEPHTLSDVVREFQYWQWLYTVRNAACKEMDPGGYGYDCDGPISDRETYLDKKLEIIRPRHQREALDVLKWYLQSERHQSFSGSDNDAVYLNLIGVHIGDALTDN
ncbi:hypothetical protein [Yersinia bercovieri]|uniref:Helix-turn-helix domain containing protein n=1 Tax=Yersinia bercovieri TaxID=634 RepID=A0A2G4U3W8_YERBE|nr:hypothetical protein [Yersinia bercovieri]MDN0102992.1 hypothetical protein [Yersinia bercovieri]PHZ27456.1 hypothetical protein CS533_11045 [Yersinia bercovieri]